ncbi:MAG TPA: OmpA family protein [Geminicoccaceae bacterium]|nr:OmpA family protein [Geminicoccaceae bacterium]
MSMFGSRRPARPTILAVGALASCLALAAACASGPNPAVESARAAVQAAQADPTVVQHAPIPLREAEQALDRAERAEQGDADEAEVAHLAYLAEQQAAIAEAAAVEQQSQQQIATVGREIEQELRDLRVQRTERGTVVTFVGDFLFDVNRATLKPGAQNQLLRLAEFLRGHPGRRALIEGHTDSTGGSEYNLDLSQARADAVAQFLMRNGVPPQQIMARGYGQTRPIASDDTASGRQQNRRVEVVILDEGQPMPGVAGAAG